MSGHLRPHPTEVAERHNMVKKMQLASSAPPGNYFFVCNPDDYCEFDIRNKEDGRVIVYDGLRAAMAYSELPVIFFTCYDVGDSETFGVFVRHVICCVADKRQSTVYMFDMRNLRQISNMLKRTLETEFSKLARTRMTIVNGACVDRSKCVYLQRFKGDTEMGWCIAWALYFLNHLIEHPQFARMAKKERRKHLAELYRKVDHQLESPKSNHFIEAYYMQLMGL